LPAHIHAGGARIILAMSVHVCVCVCLCVHLPAEKTRKVIHPLEVLRFWRHLILSLGAILVFLDVQIFVS